MKTLLPAIVLALMAFASYAATKTVSPFFILIYPASTIETDLHGRCVRVVNIGDALVYLPAGDPATWNSSLSVAADNGKLKVTACGAR